ncbi:predicted protein [Naegleria gruberi]|uniref:Predicted protein n=1 Tax=Naegleria gruberi TaxID=5762 RepID=D2W4C5_NAEGR|nr:uncharacterized protein NAEGRDRAFT_54587 [Naegleria gruberi]EFC36079.1 predicted protein [Naegleria gruberi]|eukprot:XP_002668823.1 predicted protein [Naegleria gruberi strain NEG-M]
MMSSAEQQQQHLSVVEDSDQRMVEHNEVPIMAKPGEANAYFPSYTTNHPVERDSDEDETEEVDDDENGGRFFDPLFEFKEQDRLLPYANIERIMKKTVEMFNKSAKISKEAKECMQECVTEFICFVTGEASDLCVEEKRKTVAGEDVLNALEKLGFENYCKFLYWDEYCVNCEKVEP